jgi:cell wall-associated NlpC family hydrolase
VHAAAPFDGISLVFMRPIRFLMLLLALGAGLGLALVRPLPGRATGDSGSTATVSDPLPPLTKTLRLAQRTLASRQPEPGIFGARVVDYAKRFLGVPYVYGGSMPRSGFDCSGLVRYVYSHFGVSLPHSSFADLYRGRRVGRWHLHPGDLVFFYDAGHVGIYVGRQRFIDAPHTGSVVRISSMREYGSFSGARRLKP